MKSAPSFAKDDDSTLPKEPNGSKIRLGPKPIWGMSAKAGNPRLRTTLIQLAWLWLRNQPQSALALWFKDRVCRNGGRLKKTTIVALARKLLVVLWKYVTAGVVIEGAIVKSA